MEKGPLPYRLCHDSKLVTICDEAYNIIRNKSWLVSEVKDGLEKSLYKTVQSFNK